MESGTQAHSGICLSGALLAADTKNGSVFTAAWLLAAFCGGERISFQAAVPDRSFPELPWSAQIFSPHGHQTESKFVLRHKQEPCRSHNARASLAGRLKKYPCTNYSILRACAPSRKPAGSLTAAAEPVSERSLAYLSIPGPITFASGSGRETTN